MHGDHGEHFRRSMTAIWRGYAQHGAIDPGLEEGLTPPSRKTPGVNGGNIWASKAWVNRAISMPHRLIGFYGAS